jgi:hypothetical protein
MEYGSNIAHTADRKNACRPIQNRIASGETWTPLNPSFRISPLSDRTRDTAT